MKFFSRLLGLLLLTGLLQSTAHSQSSLPEKRLVVDSAQSEGQSYLQKFNDAYFLVEKLNDHWEEPPQYYNFQTPQATLEHFIMAVEDKDYRKAAYALNTNQLPSKIPLDTAAILAEKLHYLMQKRVNIDWDKLPDRPDGQIDNGRPDQSATSGEPRKSIRFGVLSYEDRMLPLRLARYKIKDRPPVWLISANTVEDIEVLYELHGPSKVERSIPPWADFKVLGMPFWKLVGALLMLLITYLVITYLKKLIKGVSFRFEKPWIRGIGNNVASPFAFSVGLLLLYLVLNHVLSLSGPIAPYLYATLLVLVIGSITWLILRTINYGMDRFQESEVADISEEENLESRKLLTYISVARRVITFILILICIGVVLSQFPALQNAGFSLMASAGIATVILGIAAQSTLGNIIAGLNIAFTKPARIGDSVIFEGEYGTVQDIRFTYLIIKTWDQRRLIIPLQYFITHPFENWSMTNPHLIKPIHLFLDFKVDVEKVRKKFAELLKASEDYDEEKPPVVQVVGSTKDAVELRALCSAKDAATAWDLHCKLREELISYVAQLENGEHLVKERVELKKLD